MIEAATALAPAKLNLFLHINGRRSDGFHELQTLFQSVDLCDSLHFVRRPASCLESPETSCSSQITLSLQQDSEILPGTAASFLQDNLILDAARALRQHSIDNRGSDPLEGMCLDIALLKRIPAGAGLGGGSSDAATTLLTLDALWGLGTPEAELAELALELGADVPYFLQCSPCLANGVGELLEPVTLASERFLLLHPDCHLSTPALFADSALTRNTPKRSIAPALRAELSDHLDALWNGSDFANDFEAVARNACPEVDMAFQLAQSHELHCRLTGSGSTVFMPLGQLSAEAAASRVSDLLASLPQGCGASLVQGLNTVVKSI